MNKTHLDLEPADSGFGSPSKASAFSAVLAALNLLNLGILIVDHEYRIIFANDYATKILRSSKGTGVRSTSSTDRAYGIRPFDKRLRDAIADGGHGADGLLALTGAGNNSTVVQIVPYSSDQPGRENLSGSILFVSDAVATPDLDLRPAATLYGLTRAESRLLEALLSGETIGSYARNGGITLNTVKGHLAQLFRKTQTCRQSELVLRVLGNPVFRLVATGSPLTQSEGEKS
jgi:DNA-binding CsgD family transcriptional regulator